MPSLRKTHSSPSVRTSPYNIASGSSPTRTGARSPRRSSGSDTVNRRVLADIDWWRVEDSQREVRGLSPHDDLRPAMLGGLDDDELDQEEREPLPGPTLLTFASDAGDNAGGPPLWHSVPGGGLDLSDSLATRFTTWSAGVADLEEPPESPSAVEQFAALSLNPVGRAALHRTDSISSAFSDASFDSDSSFSTPSSSPLGIDFGFSDFALAPSVDSDDENEPHRLPLSRATRRPARAPVRTGRSASYSFIEDRLSGSRRSRDVFDDDFSAPSPFSPNSFGGDDDLFF
ncbi:hypothetical protein PsYK624_068890 [Phanerochaete sordida]|uniref:Uncharacterized protein n=1 Tax=Phanerochaete sordida TaxID=48140 RepID=A0A9P3LD03_9APHY|nr:hypothetical protein PsYK624_068890 [Phanerochaete sordida]